MKIKVGSDFSGVGAFDFALKRIFKENEIENVFACDMDKYARQSYLANHYSPGYYPSDVYEREIPSIPLDVYMTSPPCQSFSMAGKRLGKNDKRGILFFNSYEFIKQNQPRFFIFENVKGLLSDDDGKTFQEWNNYLGGKSVNGLPVIFPYDECVNYHIYYKVLNSRKYGVPQNRERIFIIGIRDDNDNNFRFPKEVPLEKRLKDILEQDVDEKYFLSEKMISGFINKPSIFRERFKPHDEKTNYAAAITTCNGSRVTDNFISVGYINQDTQASQVYSDEGLSPTLSAGTHGYANGYVIGAIRGRENKQTLEINKTETSNSITTVQKDNVLIINSNTQKGFDTLTENDSLNFSVPNSKTRRGRVGKGVAQTLDTQCNQGVLSENKIRRLTPLECFRLQDFPDSFVENCKNAGISDTQLYKQAGNSITVKVLELIIRNLNL